jgi:hypothetical protein
VWGEFSPPALRLTSGRSRCAVVGVGSVFVLVAVGVCIVSYGNPSVRGRCVIVVAVLLLLYVD